MLRSCFVSLIPGERGMWTQGNERVWDHSGKWYILLEFRPNNALYCDMRTVHNPSLEVCLPQTMWVWSCIPTTEYYMFKSSMKFQNSYLVNDRYALEVGKARPILRSHPLRLRSSAIRQDSDMTKAKVPHLHRALSAAEQPSTHVSTPSREALRYLFQVQKCRQERSSSPVPTSDLSTRRKQKDILNTSKCWYQGEEKNKRWPG